MMFRRVSSFIMIIAMLMVLVACNNTIEITITFDSNGGSSVSSIQTDGTSTIKLPDDPIKEGYVFFRLVLGQ